MNLEQAIKNINRSITKKYPKTISPQWIKNHCKISYQFIINNIKDEFDEPDWDFVTARIDKKLRKLWLRGAMTKHTDIYEDQNELNLILDKYRDRLYLFVSRSSREDMQICDQISIRLVRLSQKGNLLAKKELTDLIHFIINQWAEGYRLGNWRGYNDLIIECLEGCIKRYRYSGSFLGYLFRTLEYSGRALKPLESFSLNQPSQFTERVTIDRVVKDLDMQKIIIYR